MLRKRSCLPRPPPSRWHTALLQALLIKRYVYTAGCKLGSDWLLRAQPLAMLLAAAQPLTGLAVLVPWILSWGLLGLDLTVSALPWSALAVAAHASTCGTCRHVLRRSVLS